MRAESQVTLYFSPDLTSLSSDGLKSEGRSQCKAAGTFCDVATEQGLGYRNYSYILVVNSFL